jgi:hypothetical protein
MPRRRCSLPCVLPSFPCSGRRKTQLGGGSRGVTHVDPHRVRCTVVGSELSGVGSVVPASARRGPPPSPSPHGPCWRGVVGPSPKSAPLPPPPRPVAVRSGPSAFGSGPHVPRLRGLHPHHLPTTRLRLVCPRLCGRRPSQWWQSRALPSPVPHVDHRVGALCSCCHRPSVVFARPGRRQTGAYNVHQCTPVPHVPCATPAAFVILLPT